ncbi:hypothetical protein EDF85_2537 [Pseudomonas putida]|jgi:hypothetical protein|uniref:Uncharacterized protein n=1 Tax=Pseudomonas putida TaxID=303 RepID=A0A9X8EGD4_PSEPU|nr:hypothetical protein EDF85_2537 [Pseudomonas putida]
MNCQCALAVQALEAAWRAVAGQSESAQFEPAAGALTTPR